MNIYTQTQLIDLELQRVKNLSRIANYFLRREKKATIAVTMNTTADFILASNDNSDSFNEVLSGKAPEVTELHYKACNVSGVEYCICDELMGKNKATEAVML